MRNLVTLILFSLFILSQEARTQLYVSLSNNKVVRYDTSSSNPSNIAASAQTFISTNLNDPAGMVVDSNGNFYVANYGYGANSISYFNSVGQYQSSISQNVNSPYGIALDSQNNIYVASPGYGVSKINNSGNLFWSIQPKVINYLGEMPNSIALDSNNNVYVSMYMTGNLLKISSEGQILKDSSENGGIFGATTGIAINSENKLYVGLGGTTNGRILITNDSFDPLGTISTTTTPSGLNPLGVAFDNEGNLYVSSFNFNTISKFDTNGNFLFNWTTEATPNSLMFSVPEPSAFSLLAVGLGGLAILRRRRS